MRTRLPLLSLTISVLIVLLSLLSTASASDLTDGTIAIPRSGQEIVSLPSPEAAALCTHLNHSIDYSTGRVKISIPLYTYDCGGITVPISMSYQTGGIKADAQVGVLGVGWDMDYGGYVSRSVVGLPDNEYGISFINAIGTDIDEISLDELTRLHHGSADAMHDRYYYRAGAYSGCFIMKRESKIIKLPYDDVRIVRTTSGFDIITPDGTLYRYDLTERLDYTYTPGAFNNSLTRQSYGCDCMWRLTKVLSPSRTDSLVYTYEPMESLTKRNSQRTIAVGWDTQNPTARWSHPSNEGINSYSTHIYSNRHRIASISGRGDVVTFQYTGSMKERCTGLTVRNIYGDAVRSVTFTRGDRTLSAYRICDGASNVLDGADFSYFALSGTGGKDMYGYRNGGGDPNYSGYVLNPPGTNNELYDSALDKLLRPSWRRMPVFNHTRSESLRSIATVAGTLTEFEYEPSDGGNFLTYGKISPGLRLRCETVTDRNTGNVRVRDLSYYDPMPSVDFSEFNIGDFVSLSGYYQSQNSLVTKYSTGASLSASCRLQGDSPENACVYYSRVRETISGTGLETPSVTDYEYDTSQTCTPLTTHNNWWSDTDLRVLGAKRYTDLISAPTNDAVPSGVYQQLLSPKYVRGYYQEQFGERAPLLRVTHWTSPPNEEPRVWKQTVYHNRWEQSSIYMGLYCESAVRIPGGPSDMPNINNIGAPRFNSVADFNKFKMWCGRNKVFVDSISETEYDELGTSRTLVHRFGYNDHPLDWVIDSGYVEIHHPEFGSFPTYQTIVVPGPILNTRTCFNTLERTRILSCGNEWVRVDHVYSSSSSDSSMVSLDQYWRLSLPVEEYYMSGRGRHISDCEVSQRFGYTVLNGVPSDVRLCSNVISRKDGRSWVTVDSTAMGGHDVYGNPQWVAHNGGNPTYYTWTCSGTVPYTASKCGQTRYYWWRPLVGCTGIWTPAGTHTAYTYAGSRLSEVQVESETTRLYTYRTHGTGSGDGFNYVEEKTVADPATSTGANVRKYFDGFGNTIGVAVASTDWASVIGTLDVYDALGRRVRGYSPRPAFCSQVVPTSPNVYSDTVPYATGATPSYSGNIGGSDWRGADNLPRRYGYTYDGLNRLVSAAYIELAPRPANQTVTGVRSYGTSYTYGLDSRPLTVTRQGVRTMAFGDDNTVLEFGTVDALSMQHSGGRLTKVSDSAADVVYTGASDFVDGADSDTEYTYDANGNMTSDANRGIVSIEYNALNLPARITLDDGSEIVSVYSADGALLQRLLTEPYTPRPFVPFSGVPPTPNIPTVYTTTAYNHMGPLTYQGSQLERIDTPNGFISDGDVYFYIKDYQGNVRQVVDADGTVLQDNHYYPYGMLMAESSDILGANRSATTVAAVNPYMFGAKEYLPFKGTNLLDFSARFYDPATLIFGTPDPMRGDYLHLHSWLYCGANPVVFIDPTGMKIVYNEGAENIEELKKSIDFFREKSKIFANLYKSLDDSKETYTISCANLEKPDLKSGGKWDKSTMTITIDNSNLGQCLVASEEFYHAFQDADTDYDGDNFYTPDVNIEFEAKTFAMCVNGEVYEHIRVNADQGLDNWMNFLVDNSVDGNIQSLINTITFLDEYKSACKTFIEYNRTNNIGNSHYKNPSTTYPFRLGYALKIRK